jgi:transposase-like protein
MRNETSTGQAPREMPTWVPKAARIYLDHTEQGTSIRQLARGAGCHASTILRQVRKLEARRDDPLIDEALSNLGTITTTLPHELAKEPYIMNAAIRPSTLTPDNTTIEREAKRILRRLCEPSACLAVAKDMEKAVVVRKASDGQTTRTAVVDRPVAQAMALKDWISCDAPGRISRYHITTAGRAALKRLLSEDDAERQGFSDAASPFGDQHQVWGEREISGSGTNPSRKIRYNVSESPVASLARRKDKDGTPFLANDLVAAAERLREDFELAQMGPRVAQNWDRFLTGGGKGGLAHDGQGGGSSAARDRVAAALRNLGPGLGDVVLRVACFLEGMEAAEKRMGWSARSGKIVLRIALQRLKRHYQETGGGEMIG